MTFASAALSRAKRHVLGAPTSPNAKVPVVMTLVILFSAETERPALFHARRGRVPRPANPIVLDPADANSDRPARGQGTPARWGGDPPCPRVN